MLVLCLVFSSVENVFTLSNLIGDERDLISYWIPVRNNALWQCSAMRIFCDFCQQVHAVDCEQGGTASREGRFAVEIKS